MNNKVTLSKIKKDMEVYRNTTDNRIKEILTSKSTVVPTGNGKAYYVSESGDDNNNGLSADTAWKTLGKVDITALKEGDVIYFRRGDTFRGCFNAQHGVSYSAYGNGDKPILTTSPYNAAKVGKWLQTDVPCIYKFSLPVSDEVGLLVMNDGECYATKICPVYIDGKPAYDYASGIPFTSYADLPGDLCFFHDFSGPVYKSKSGGWIYLYSSEGNPSERFDSIEFSVDLQKGVTRCKNNNVFDNLCFRFSCFGISAGVRYVTNLTVQNCEFSWIGGSIYVYKKRDEYLYPVRYGNGVEIFGSCNGFRVNDCYFYQMYDAAVSPQFDALWTTENAEMLNVECCRNAMEYCQYGFEYFNGNVGGKTGNAHMENLSVEDNYMWYAGRGICEQRPNHGESAHIKSWNHDNPCSGNFAIRNNVFAFGVNMLVESLSKMDSILPEYDGNTYIQQIGKGLGRYGSTKSGGYIDNFFDVGAAETVVRDTFGDKNAKVVFINGD